MLDLGLALSGPTCGRILAEFGAEVVKISKPDAGVAGYLNRGKKSLLLDLAPVAGQEVYWRLVDQADVVLENFSPGTAERLGIGYDEVSARRPQTIYTSLSCYGLNGPWTTRRGWERQGQAVTGIMERTGLPSVLGPYNIVDIGTGILGAFATALALYHRFVTGRGQVASASLAQTATYHQAAYMFDFDGYQPAEPRGYDALGEGPLQRYYRAADEWFFLAARPEDLPALAQVTGDEAVAASEGAALEQALEAAFADSRGPGGHRPAAGRRRRRARRGADRRGDGRPGGPGARAERDPGGDGRRELHDAGRLAAAVRYPGAGRPPAAPAGRGRRAGPRLGRAGRPA